MRHVKIYGLLDSLKFGKFQGKTVMYVIGEDPSYLIWIYYNLSNVTFDKQVLIILEIDDSEIDKPGINPDLGEKMISGFNAIKKARREKYITKAVKEKKKKILMVDQKTSGSGFKKWELQQMNHGKMKFPRT